MKGSKKLNQLLEDNEKKLKKLFKYDKKEALSFTCLLYTSDAADE